jgi:hypothetical protein
MSQEHDEPSPQPSPTFTARITCSSKLLLQCLKYSASILAALSFRRLEFGHKLGVLRILFGKPIRSARYFRATFYKHQCDEGSFT